MPETPAATPAAPAAEARAPGRRWLATVTVLLAVGAVLGAAYVVAKAWDVGSQRRPESGDVLFAQTLDVGPKGAAVRVRVGKPSRLVISVRGRVPMTVAFGQPRPPEAGPEDAPDELGLATWTAEPGAGPHEEIVLAAGLYVLRLDPLTSAGAAVAPGRVDLRVTAAPPR